MADDNGRTTTGIDKEAALEEKNLGNEYFKAEKFDEAIEHYNKAIEFDSSDTTFLNNKAMCHIRLGKFYDAKCDCDKAILLDSGLTKAYYRRAMANKELYRFRHTIDDLEKVIQLEPDFEPARRELIDISKRVQQDERIAMKVPIKPEHLRSDKPVKCFQLLNQYSGSKIY